MKRIIAALMAAGAVSVAVLPAGATAGSTSSKNIVQIASASPQFSTLVSLVKSAGLVSALEGKGPLTVFAPTNAAFAKVPAATLKALGQRKNRAELVKVLEYHVVAGDDTAATIVRRHVAHDARRLEADRQGQARPRVHQQRRGDHGEHHRQQRRDPRDQRRPDPEEPVSAGRVCISAPLAPGTARRERAVRHGVARASHGVARAPTRGCEIRLGDKLRARGAAPGPPGFSASRDTACRRPRKQLALEQFGDSSTRRRCG